MRFRWQEKVRRLRALHAGENNMVSRLTVMALLFCSILQQKVPCINAARLSQNVQESQLDLLFCDDDSQ